MGENHFVVAKILISKRAAYNIGDIYVNVLQPFIPNGLSNLDFVLQIKKVGNTCSMLKNILMI